MEKSVPPLFFICKEFIACNLHMVESFNGFPDIIGKEIFKMAESRRVFDLDKMTQPKSIYSLQLFNFAYRDKVLESLNVNRQYLGVNYCLELLMLFEHLKELDVSSCSLGDKHEILQHVIKLISLEKLSLADNNISDEGLKLLSTPFRVMNRGPRKLKYLNIAGNSEVTCESITRYVAVFPNLKDVDITDTSVTKTKKILDDWDFKAAKTDDFVPMETSGWASEVVQAWIVSAATKTLEKPKSRATLTFYSRKRKFEEITKQSTVEKEKRTHKFRLMLKRKTLCHNCKNLVSNISDECVQTESNQNKQTKPSTIKGNSASKDIFKHSVQRKEMDNILEIYENSSVVPKSKRQKTLWENMQSGLL